MSRVHILGIDYHMLSWPLKMNHFTKLIISGIFSFYLSLVWNKNFHLHQKKQSCSSSFKRYALLLHTTVSSDLFHEIIEYLLITLFALSHLSLHVFYKQIDCSKITGIWFLLITSFASPLVWMINVALLLKYNLFRQLDL